MNTKPKHLYGDMTGESSKWHAVIVEAIKAGGKLPEELADIFVLTKTPEGSACEWVLNWA